MNWRAAGFRLKLLAVLIFISLWGLWFRLFCLQALNCDTFREIARGMHTRKVPIRAVRGKIYDRRGEILALSVPGKSVFASPAQITDCTGVSRALAGALSLNADEIESKIRRRPESQFVWVKRVITPTEEATVRSLRLKGAYLREESRRFYPYGRMLAQVIGFAGVDQQGLSGVEFACDSKLKGRDGYRTEYRDALARGIALPALEFVPAQDGCHVVLTVDANIQDFLESAVERCWQSHKPKAVTAVTLDPRTGEVLALAQRPTFDPADYARYDEKAWRLRAVTDTFEPGSMFKPFVFSAALEEGLVRLPETIFCEEGTFRIGNRVLHDHHSYGNLTALQVVSKSSNIGMAKIGARLGPAACRSYLQAFGFGRPSGLGFQGEAPGYLTPLAEWSHYTMSSVPMGHEVAVNAVQVAAAFSVFANGGWLIRPRMIRGVLAPDGTPVEKYLQPAVRQRVLRAATARTMLETVLREVVVSGTGRLAQLERYAVAGKTGTAQKLVDGRYSHSAYVSSFICTGPVPRPCAVVLFVVDEPSSGPGRFGGSVAAPYAAEALEATLDYIFIDGRPHGGEFRYAAGSAATSSRTPALERSNAP
ncbi:MAG: peptidoglycan D,D-transpeptidase FtsI family protein [Planctomycetota bacterium]